jgi:amino acid adenylation domain-containing protein
MLRPAVLQSAVLLSTVKLRRSGAKGETLASKSVSPDIREMSEAKRRLLMLRLKGTATPQATVDEIQPRPAGARTPISVDQYRIWLHASIQQDLPIYNEPVAITYRGALDLALLETSFNRFVARHEAWRTSFVVEKEEVLQVIHPELAVKLERIDLSGMGKAERVREAKRLATQQARAPIDLTSAPLLRAFVITMTPDEHQLHLVLHHIIFDGMSLTRTFIPELATTYEALRAGVEPLLAKKKLQYCDYAAWRQQQVDAPAMDLHVDYWRRQLGDELPVLRLPADRPRPAVISQRGDVEHFVLSRELTASLRKLGNAHGATLYMTMLAVFQVLLFRYTGQEDIIVGGAGDGRRRPELQGMMGYILDTFAIRSRPIASMPFSAFLNSVRQTTIEALDAADVPFDRVVRAVGSKRVPSHHPLFQSFFVFQPDAQPLPAGWDMSTSDVVVGAAKFDVYLEVDERPTSTLARILYSTDLFDADRIRRMAGHWTNLLEAVCHAPECVLGELPLLTPEEQELMLVRWNDTARELPATTVHGLVEAQVQRTPDIIAVQFNATSWSYAQLDQRAALFAMHLRKAGAGHGKLVALCLDRSENMLAGLLAILKTGAAYLPLDPGVPRARLLLCLEDAAPVVVFTQGSVAADLPASKAKVLILEEVLKDAEGLPEGQASSHFFQPVRPGDIAYVIHTSGSTGRPKAVELRHDSVVNLLLSMRRTPGFSAADTLLAVTTVSFDIAVLELFLPLISGGRVVIASREVALDPTLLADLMRSTGCTVMQATPSTWRALIANKWQGQAGLRVLCGGEKMPRDLADKLLALEVELWNVYGPTETTIWSTVQRVLPGRGPVSIGAPIANTTTFILDANQQPLPVGVPGELYIGGVGLANGYRDQPELTAQKFVYPKVANGERLYRTGDYAAYRADGSIECRGRADHQVKVRGFRIELEEVENAICKHPAVAAVAVRVWPDALGGNRLAAYVVAKHGSHAPATELRVFLRTYLPDYMIPSDVIELAAIPLTSNGKTDRNALPAIDPRTLRTIAALPSTDVELKLAKIWAEVLGVDAVGLEDNFFDLGGHSLMLVTLFSRINREFEMRLPITAIFETSNLAELAKLLKSSARLSSLVPVQTSGARPPLFMAHSYLLYRGLSTALGSDQPFYGLRELEDEGNLSVKERALRYIEDMRTVQPQGPYRIAGWCAAGPIAFEIAAQLHLAGEQIALLLLFDSWLPGYAENLQKIGGKGHSFHLLKSLRGKLARYRTRMDGLDTMAQVRHGAGLLRRKLKERRDRFYVKHWAHMERVSNVLRVPLPQFMHNTTLKTYAALSQFEAETLPVAMTLIRARQTSFIAGASDACGWDQVAQAGVNVLWTSGDHETMFLGNNLKMTAELIALALGDTQPLYWPWQRQQSRGGATSSRW